MPPLARGRDRVGGALLAARRRLLLLVRVQDSVEPSQGGRPGRGGGGRGPCCRPRRAARRLCAASQAWPGCRQRCHSWSTCQALSRQQDRKAATPARARRHARPPPPPLATESTSRPAVRLCAGIGKRAMGGGQWAPDPSRTWRTSALIRAHNPLCEQTRAGRSNAVGSWRWRRAGCTWAGSPPCWLRAASAARARLRPAPFPSGNEYLCFKTGGAAHQPTRLRRTRQTFGAPARQALLAFDAQGVTGRCAACVRPCSRAVASLQPQHVAYQRAAGRRQSCHPCPSLTSANASVIRPCRACAACRQGQGRGIPGAAASCTRRWRATDPSSTWQMSRHAWIRRAPCHRKAS